MIIESGAGNSDKCGVSSDNRLLARSIVITSEHFINHQQGQVYSVGVELIPTAAGDCFFYIKNTNDVDLIVSEFMLSVVTDETITIKLGDSGTPIGGTDMTLVNRNAGSGNEADATAYYGVDITGLSGGSPVMSAFLKGGESGYRIAPLSAFIVPKNKVITGYVTTGGISVKVGMGISFHDAGE